MSTICNCSSSNGGGTKCPDQNIAICVQGKDGRCYGECIPIPSQFKHDSNHFQVWLKQVIQQESYRHGLNFLSIKYNYSFRHE